jgi:hypothetical protein
LGSVEEKSVLTSRKKVRKSMVFGKVPTTVAMAMEWYGQSLRDAKRTRELSNLKSALKRCLLTGYGFERDELSSKAGLHCCLSRLSLREFRKAKVVFQEVATARQNAGEMRFDCFQLQV